MPYSGVSTDYMHERNIDNVKDERKVRLAAQTNAEQELQRAKLYGQE